MPSAASKPSSYIPGLDGIRAIAFLLVFSAHALLGLSYYIPATLGVTIFFFLSGYLITTLLRREFAATGTIALRDFYLRRVLRIFIPLYIVYALAMLGAHFLTHQSPGNLFGFASVYLYFHNYTIALRAHAFTPPGMELVWSLSVEEHFYLLFPLAYFTMLRRGLSARSQARLLIGFCLLELAWRVVLIAWIKPAGPWTYVATDARLDSILWGSVLAVRNNPAISTDRSILPRNYELLCFLLAVAGLVATLIPRSDLYRGTLRYTLQPLTLYVIFSFLIRHIRHPLARWLEWLPLRYIGWTSYVLYLCHDFFLYAIQPPLAAHPLLVVVFGFAAALGFATLMRYTVEQPVQRLRARLRHLVPNNPVNLGPREQTT
ncbi:acyltransferase [Granulicella sp. 5B5]|uniref:acyltransferase family protein n=1 Tax=Granulicella sp. 5B5 TaxID=1617967 RepID=UPI0015F6AD2F|nr:acyltransferase [Granulicella sp. 5B5]